MNIGIILGGGTGSRMGMADKPKQFIDVYGKPILIHTLEAFEVNDRVDAICVVSLPEWMDDINQWIKQYDIRKVRWTALAGEERRDSSFNGLKAIQNDVSPEDIVLIHDAARPLISQRIINDNIDGALKYGAVDTCIPAHDTIVRTVDGYQTIDSLPVRSELMLGQTPQSFRYSVILDAQQYYDQAPGDKPFITDDTGLVLFRGGTVAIALGDKMNLKVTTFDDLLMLKSLIRTNRG